MPSLEDAAAGRPRIADGRAAPTDAAVRVVSQAVRALVSEECVLAVNDLTAVTRLDAAAAAVAMERLARVGPFEVEARPAGAEPAWTVVRTDRW